MTLPNFLIIGAARSGTTTLYYVLNQHPEIFMCPIKEPEFFWAYGEQVNFQGPNIVWIKHRLVNDLEEYEHLFAGVTTEKAIGEASPRYLTHPRSPGLIHKFIPDAKLIVSLRQPAERAFSAYLNHKRDGVEPCSSFDDAIKEELAGSRDHWTKGGYLDRGLYYAALSRYYEYFDRSQMHISLFEDLQANPRELIRDIFHFLGVYEAFEPVLERPHNASGVIRNPVLRFLWTNSGGLRAAVRPYVHEHTRHKMFEWVIKDLEREKLSPEVKAELTEYFRPDIEKLQDLIGRDLSHWLKPVR